MFSPQPPLIAPQAARKICRGTERTAEHSARLMGVTTGTYQYKMVSKAFPFVLVLPFLTYKLATTVQTSPHTAWLGSFLSRVTHPAAQLRSNTARFPKALDLLVQSLQSPSANHKRLLYLKLLYHHLLLLLCTAFSQPRYVLSPSRRAQVFHRYEPEETCGKRPNACSRCGGCRGDSRCCRTLGLAQKKD